MGKQTKIEWTHHTFSPWRGCTKVSPGCAHCYAETMSKRNPAVLGVWGDRGTRVIAAESYWRQPLKWNAAAAKAGERRRVFAASLADVFEDRPELCSPRQRLFHLIGQTPNLDWLLLTKRPENVGPLGVRQQLWYPQDGLPRNVWLGTSVEDQACADERIPHLLRTPAAVRFLSVEPLLGPVDLNPAWLSCDNAETVCPACGEIACDCGSIDWVIIGGESGPQARPCRVSWIRSLVEQCQIASVPVFVKQLGAHIIDRNDAFGGWDDQQWPDDLDIYHRVEEHIHGFREDHQGADVRMRLLDGKGGNPEEWPADLRVREFPR